MFKKNDFSIENGQLKVKKDSYPISKIRRVRVVENELVSHATKSVIISLIVSSILWLFEPFATPWGFDLNVGIIAFIVTFPVVLLISYFKSKYQLKVEFDHCNEVGVQWISIANGRTAQEAKLFKDIEENLVRNIV
ncbi:TPA: hypothetical protein ACRZZH_005156 [Vibrio harveyi]|uniref:hypothetical protein n=1 Tax=Vibrio harveyi TaxID=669 RepID=UPI0029BC621A|nr:hypothetical protein [Vibrio harveyi]HDM8174518.1 hypothetical protein [Vibrio harveyi]